MQNGNEGSEQYRAKNVTSFAKWLINPDDYDEAAGDSAMGGVIFESLTHPVNCAVDGKGFVIVGQDSVPYVQRIQPPDGAANRARRGKDPVAGPGVVAAPDGSVWVACLKASGLVNRFPPGNAIPTVVEVAKNSHSQKFEKINFAAAAVNWAGQRTQEDVPLDYEALVKAQIMQATVGKKVIHFAFATKPRNIMYVLTTSLLSPTNSAPEEVLEVFFDDDWAAPLPDQEAQSYSLGLLSSTHRIITVPHPVRPLVVITLWAADQLTQLTNFSMAVFVPSRRMAASQMGQMQEAGR